MHSPSRIEGRREAAAAEECRCGLVSKTHNQAVLVEREEEEEETEGGERGVFILEGGPGSFPDSRGTENRLPAVSVA